MDDAREELIAITRATRALLEWHRECGAEGLPTQGHPAELPDLLRGIRNKKAAPAAQMVRSATEAATAGLPAGRGQPVSSGSVFPGSVFPSSVLGIAAPTPDAQPQRQAATAPPRVMPFDGPAMPALDRPPRLAVLSERVKSCTRCALHATRKQTVFSRGSPDAELCFIGEGPGFDEDAQGEPFVGKAGQLLDKMIAAMGIGRDEVYVCNIVKCRPPDNRTPEASEMASCMPYLTEQLEIVRPRVMVALGSTAVKGLLGTTEGITKIRGSWRLYRGSVPVMPTFHPAYVLRQPTKEVRGMVWSDLQQVLKELGRSVPTRAG